MNKLHNSLSKEEINILNIFSIFREWNEKWKQYDLNNENKPESIDVLLENIKNKYDIKEK